MSITRLVISHTNLYHQSRLTCDLYSCSISSAQDLGVNFPGSTIILNRARRIDVDALPARKT